MKMPNYGALAVSIGVPLLSGQILGLLAVKDVRGWYTKLRKPKWCPPNFLFAPIWTVLYTAGGVASWLVWKQKAAARALPLSLYAVQLVLNLAWTPIFFKTHRIDVALADAAAMLGVAVAATVAMSKAAGREKVLPLMGPYCAFAAFATALTYNFYKNNSPAASVPTMPPAVLGPSHPKKE